MEPVLADDEAVAAFARDGVACVRQVLSAQEVAAAATAIDVALARRSPLAQVASGTDDPGAFVEDFCRWREIPQIERLARDSRVPALAAALPLAPALVAPCLQMVEEVTDELSCFSDSVLYGAPLPADVCERARLALDRGLARIVTAAVAAGVAFDPVANCAWACELCARVGYANEGISDMDEPNLRLVRHFQQHVLGTPVTP